MNDLVGVQHEFKATPLVSSGWWILCVLFTQINEVKPICDSLQMLKD